MALICWQMIISFCHNPRVWQTERKSTARACSNKARCALNIEITASDDKLQSVAKEIYLCRSGLIKHVPETKSLVASACHYWLTIRRHRLHTPATTNLCLQAVMNSDFDNIGSNMQNLLVRHNIISCKWKTNNLKITADEISL